jgi:branched-chain amino acid transport system permease protein
LNAHTVIPALLFGILLLAPVLAGDIPIVLTLLAVALYYAIVASNWNLLYGFAGVWSFAQLGFFAIGAYSSALMSVSGTSPWLGMLVGLAISVSVAFGVSLIGLRLRATYFALATFGLAEVIRGFLVMIYPGVIFDIPALQIGGFSFLSFDGLPYYYFFLLLFALSLVVQKRLISSRIGLAAVAIRESERRSISLGVEPVRVRTILFLVSVVFTSLTGSVYAHYTNAVGQSIMQYDLFLGYILIMGLGGLGTFYGPMIASFIWIFMDFLLRLYVDSLRLVIMGAIVIVTLIYSRKGLVGFYERLAVAYSRYHASNVRKRTDSSSV